MYLPAQVQRKVAVTRGADSAGNDTERKSKNSFEPKSNKGNIMKELNLSREQKVKLKELRQANKSKRDEILNNDGLSEAQKQVKLKETKTRAAFDLQAILTTDQQEKMKSKRKERRSSSRKDNMLFEQVE